MIKKGNLFLLVKSLSRGEKRYFRLFSAVTGTEKNYLRLFDVIGKQEKYDEEEIKKIFKGKKFSSQLHVTKIYLTELILKALRNYHAGRSKNVLISDFLKDIEILFRRELYDLCYYKILKAEKLAEEYEKLPLLLEILSWKRKLFLTMYGPDTAKINPVISKEKKYISGIQTLNSYWNYTINFFEYANDRSLLRNTLFKNRENADTLQAKILFYHTLYTYFMVNNNISKAEEYVTDLISLLEKYPERIEDDPHSYLTAISNKISLLLSCKRWEDIPPLIKIIGEAGEKYNINDDSKYTIRLRLRIFNIELEMYRDTKQPDKGIELIEKINLYLKKHKNSVSQDYLILFYYQFASIFFLKKNFRESLKWLNEIINSNFGKIREDIQIYARLLNLIIHFELNNIIVLRYAVDSTRRFLVKRKLLTTLFKNILRLFSQLSLSLPEKYPVYFRKAYEDIYSGNDQDTISRLQDYIDLKGWIEEKLAKSSPL